MPSFSSRTHFVQHELLTPPSRSMRAGQVPYYNYTSCPHTSSHALQGPPASLPIFCIQTRRPFLSRKSSTDRPPNSCSHNNNLIEKACFCDLCLPHLLAILIHLSPLHQRLCHTCHCNFSLVINCPCVDCLLSIYLNLKLPEITKPYFDCIIHF